MALFVIGDLHLALGCDKPMDIFDGWQGYVEKLEVNWRRLVAPEDTVVLAGDTSWAMKLENLDEDFGFIHNLPGKKLLLKGNHDYWWGTLSKMERYVEEKGFHSIAFLHNNSYFVEGVTVSGTRSWLFDAEAPHDAKVMNREIGRLRTSLQAAAALAPDAEHLAFLHYPPLFPGASSPEIIECMKEYGVRRCWYGHLHGASIHRAINGEVDNICYRLISADALRFTPYKIDTNGLG